MASAARGFADRAPAVGTEVVWLAVTMQAAQTRFPELLPPHRQPLHVPLVAAPAGGAQHHGPFSWELAAMGDQQQLLAAHSSGLMPWKPQSARSAGLTTRRHLVFGPPHAGVCSEAEKSGCDDSETKLPEKASHPPPTTVVPGGHLTTCHVSLPADLTLITSPCTAAQSA